MHHQSVHSTTNFVSWVDVAVNHSTFCSQLERRIFIIHQLTPSFPYDDDDNDENDVDDDRNPSNRSSNKGCQLSIVAVTTIVVFVAIVVVVAVSAVVVDAHC